MTYLAAGWFLISILNKHLECIWYPNQYSYITTRAVMRIKYICKIFAIFHTKYCHQQNEKFESSVERKPLEAFTVQSSYASVNQCLLYIWPVGMMEYDLKLLSLFHIWYIWHICYFIYFINEYEQRGSALRVLAVSHVQFQAVSHVTGISGYFGSIHRFFRHMHNF